MPKPKVMISAPYMHRQREAVSRLLAAHPVEPIWVPVQERLEEKDLLERIAPFEGALCGDDRFTPKVFEAASNLRVIVKWGTGIDSIDAEAARRHGVKVFRTPDAFTDPVADTTLGYILAFCRGLGANDRVMKSGAWEKPQGWALREKTVGLCGFGRIGQAVARRLEPFGARVLFHDVDSNIPEAFGARRVGWEKLLAEADLLSFHCDLNGTSRHLLNADALEKSKSGVFVVNTARGPVIEEPALIAALESGKVAGAGLDVFEAEPLDPASPLRKRDNVFLASHNANSSPAAWQRVHRRSIEMLVEGLNG